METKNVAWPSTGSKKTSFEVNFNYFFEKYQSSQCCSNACNRWCTLCITQSVDFLMFFSPASGSNCCRVGMNGSHAAPHLDRFFRWTCPLLVILGLFVLFAARRQVGVVGQTAEQRGDHWTGIHLLLQQTHTEKHINIRLGDLLVIQNCMRQLRGPFKISSLFTQFQHFWPCNSGKEWFHIHIPSMFWKMSSPQTEPYSCRHTAGSSPHHCRHCCWWKDCSLWGSHHLKRRNTEQWI